MQIRLNKKEKAKIDEFLVRRKYTIVPYLGDQAARMEAWIEDLLSGKYTQIKGGLSEGKTGRCCLGVACDSFKRRMKKGKWRQTSFTTEEGNEPAYEFCIGSNLEDSTTEMPGPVAKYFGFGDYEGDPTILMPPSRKHTGISDQVGVCMSTCNDTHAFSFKIIAWLLNESLKLGRKEKKNKPPKKKAA